MCRGCLVGSSEAPTRCPTASVWYFINTSANYFPFFAGLGQFRSGIGNAPYKSRCASFLASVASSVERAGGGCPPARRRMCARVRLCTHTRQSGHGRAFLVAEKSPLSGEVARKFLGQWHTRTHTTYARTHHTPGSRKSPRGVEFASHKVALHLRATVRDRNIVEQIGKLSN